MIAGVICGVFMSLMHVFSKVLPPAEYSAFGALIQVLNWMTIPSVGLQMVFAQQASAVVTEAQRRQLVGTAWAVMKWTFYIWLVMVVVVVIERDQIVAALKLGNPAALWITLIVGFLMLWLPIFMGLLQGRQNFLWLGWAAIFNGVGRAVIGGAIVYLLHGGAAGIMAGVLIGMVSALATAFWHNRELFKEAREKFDVRGWLRRVLPLTLGFGSSLFLFSADAIVVQNHLGADGQAAAYIFGGTLCRAIVLFTGPLAAVMFPKLVQSAAHSRASNLMGLTLLGTVVLGCVAAVGLMLTAPLVIKYASNPDYASILPVLTPFAWTMLPIAIANVLLNNLMAHSRFKVVPWLVVTVIGYWIALQYFHDSFKTVIQTMGVFSLIFLAVCAWFTWRDSTSPPPAATA